MAFSAAAMAPASVGARPVITSTATNADNFHKMAADALHKRMFDLSIFCYGAIGSVAATSV